MWEEVLLLVEAPDDEAAASQAAELGRRREHQYTVSQRASDVLRWAFVKIERVQMIEGPLANGAEIFSRFLRTAEAESLLHPFDDDTDDKKA